MPTVKVLDVKGPASNEKMIEKDLKSSIDFSEFIDNGDNKRIETDILEHVSEVSTFDPTNAEFDLLASHEPSISPSLKPSTHPSKFPSLAPSFFPSLEPSFVPSTMPTARPSNKPSSTPSLFPSDRPSVHPTNSPSNLPSQFPSKRPTGTPSIFPTLNPSQIPSLSPTIEKNTASDIFYVTISNYTSQVLPQDVLDLYEKQAKAVMIQSYRNQYSYTETRVITVETMKQENERARRLETVTRTSSDILRKGLLMISPITYIRALRKEIDTNTILLSTRISIRTGLGYESLLPDVGINALNDNTFVQLLRSSDASLNYVSVTAYGSQNRGTEVSRINGRPIKDWFSGNIFKPGSGTSSTIGAIIGAITLVGLVGFFIYKKRISRPRPPNDIITFTHTIMSPLPYHQEKSRFSFTETADLEYEPDNEVSAESSVKVLEISSNNAAVECALQAY